MRWRTALAAVVAIATGYVFADVAIAQGPDEGRSALLYQVSVVGVHRASHEPVVPQKPVPEYTWDANYQQPRLTESAWEAILRWSG